MLARAMFINYNGAEITIYNSKSRIGNVEETPIKEIKIQPLKDESNYNELKLDTFQVLYKNADSKFFQELDFHTMSPIDVLRTLSRIDNKQFTKKKSDIYKRMCESATGEFARKALISKEKFNSIEFMEQVGRIIDFKKEISKSVRKDRKDNNFIKNLLAGGILQGSRENSRQYGEV